jgi:hypothetical protein
MNGNAFRSRPSSVASENLVGLVRIASCFSNLHGYPTLEAGHTADFVGPRSQTFGHEWFNLFVFRRSHLAHRSVTERL